MPSYESREAVRKIVIDRSVRTDTEDSVSSLDAARF